MPYRAMLPIAPPMATHRYASIILVWSPAFRRFLNRLKPELRTVAGVISAETVRRFSHLGRQTPLPPVLILNYRRCRNGKPLTAAVFESIRIQPL